MGQYSRESSFQGWIKTITIHAALAQHKKKNSQIYQNSGAIENEDVEFDLSLMGEIDSEELFYYINKLSPGRKQVFCAYFLEGYSHKEIANLFGMSEGTSKSQLHDAKKELKNAISLNFSESRKKENHEQSR